jgi:hypothetical protein
MSKSLRLMAIVISLSLAQAPVMASVKAGSPCTKQGAKQNSGGKSFTCIKQGKKLVWNKGVALKKSAAPVVAQPQPLPSPSASPSGMSTEIPDPLPSATATKISFVPWSIAFNTEDMTQIALSKTSEYLGVVKPSNAYTLTIDPAITPSDREWITRMLDYTNGAFSNVLQGRVKVFLGTTHQWSANAMRSAGSWVGDPQSPLPCSDGSRDAYCAGPEVVLLTYSDIYKPNSNYRWDTGRRSTPAHELFHNVQFALNGPNQAPSHPNYVPRWLMEGSANYFGFYIVDKLALGTYQEGRKGQVNNNSNYTSVVPLVQYDNFNSDPYGIGQAASEYLIASVGFENFLNIWKFTKSEGSFTRGFAKAIGIELSEFYAKFEAARGSMKIGNG